MLTRALARTTTKNSFKWPLDASIAEKLISSFYLLETKRAGNSFRPTESLQTCFSDIASFLVKDRKQFGMFFCGGMGSGKTTAAKSLCRATNYLIRNGCMDGGEDYVLCPRYIKALDIVMLISNTQDITEYRNSPRLIIDDVGEEPTEIPIYGALRNPIIDLLLHRYDNRLFTIITTNLTASQFREKYGNRLGDRMKEMFKIIPFKDQSFR